MGLCALEKEEQGCPGGVQRFAVNMFDTYILHILSYLPQAFRV